MILKTAIMNIELKCRSSKSIKITALRNCFKQPKFGMLKNCVRIETLGDCVRIDVALSVDLHLQLSPSFTDHRELNRERKPFINSSIPQSSLSN